MKQAIFSKRVAKQVFATLQDETKCWEHVRVEPSGECNYYAMFHILDDSDSFSSVVMDTIIRVCSSFETIYGVGSCSCAFVVYENKPVIKVAVRIKK
jgi:hypothetical protein